MSNFPNLISSAHSVVIPEEGRLFTTLTALSHLSVQRTPDKVEIEMHAGEKVMLVRGNLVTVLSFLAQNPESVIVMKAPTEDILRTVRAEVQNLGLITLP